MVDVKDVRNEINSGIEDASIDTDKHSYSLYVDKDMGHDDYGEEYIEITDEDGKQIGVINNAYNDVDTEDIPSWKVKLDEIAKEITEIINSYEDE